MGSYTIWFTGSKAFNMSKFLVSRQLTHIQLMGYQLVLLDGNRQLHIYLAFSHTTEFHD